MEHLSLFKETLTGPQIKLLNDLKDFRIRRINWDFDQILCHSEVPVKEEFFRLTRIDYRERPIDQWLALSKWASTEGNLEYEEVAKIEDMIWSNPEVLMKAPPIEAMRTYSKEAHSAGVEQTIVTTRTPHLHHQTLDWLKIHFPWIKLPDVYIRENIQIPADEFKGAMVGLLGSDVHFDDSPKSITQVLKFSKATAILFPRNLERGRFKDDPRVIEFPDISTWAEY